MKKTSRAAPESEVSILVQASVFADPGADDFYEDLEDEALKQWGKSSTVIPSFGSSNLKLPPPQTNVWFIIRDSEEEGLKVSEIFRDSPDDKPLHSRKETNCVLVGSELYDIGGVGSTFATRNLHSNHIRRLDTENPDDGWKTETLPFNCAGACATVSGNLIYLFPKRHRFTGSSKGGWAYIYDTVERKAHSVPLPSSCVYNTPTICFPVGNSSSSSRKRKRKRSSVVVPLQHEELGFEKLFFHRDGLSPWKQSSASYAPFLLNHTKQSHAYAVSEEKGLLYLCERYNYDNAMELYVYDIRSHNAPLVCQIKLPDFESYQYDLHRAMFLIPVGDDNLCFLWHINPVRTQSFPLHYAKVSVSLDPPFATVLKQATLEIEATRALNCLPVPRGKDFTKSIGADFPVILLSKSKKRAWRRWRRGSASVLRGASRRR